MYFWIPVCLSEIKTLMAIPFAMINSMHLSKPICSMAGLLPASFLCNRKSMLLLF